MSQLSHQEDARGGREGLKKFSLLDVAGMAQEKHGHLEKILQVGAVMAARCR